MVARAKYVQKKWWGGFDGVPVDPEKLEVAAHKLADNLKCCSCHMCCNVRRSTWTKDGQTRQELRSELALREQAE
jgi:hypothetical protein